ncbi:hypothetical protein FRC18_007159 [Serendipita sp. 400]|nr:hypothetical protein FRC18_007159 [Serendipita sp. 400]
MSFELIAPPIDHRLPPPPHAIPTGAPSSNGKSKNSTLFSCTRLAPGVMHGHSPGDKMEEGTSRDRKERIERNRVKEEKSTAVDETLGKLPRVCILIPVLLLLLASHEF